MSACGNRLMMVTYVCNDTQRWCDRARLVRAPDHESFGPGERDIAWLIPLRVTDLQGSPRSHCRFAVHPPIETRRKNGEGARVVWHKREAPRGRNATAGWQPACEKENRALL